MKKIIRNPDSDLEYCFQHNCSLEPKDILTVLAQVPGEADGFSWHWVIEMKDGKFFYVTGCCDYSGWGCSDWGEAKEAKTALQAAKLGKNDEYRLEKKSIKKQLLDQLKGKQPYGLREG